MKHLILIVLMLTLVSCAWFRTDVVKPAFQEETQMVEMLKQMGDAYWEAKDFKAGLATGMASISPVTPELRMAINQLNSLADPQSEQYKKGVGLGYWINYLWYGAIDVRDRVVPPVLEILKQLGVI